MKSQTVVIQQRARGSVELSSADVTEILAALHCRRSPRSRLVIEKLARALRPKTRTRSPD